MSEILSGLVLFAIAFAVGGIPFGYLVTYAIKGIDIRTVGSGNIGATNVGRTLGFPYFLLVFALDLLKGLLPTLYLPRGAVALGIPIPIEAPVLVGLGAILGHNFPIYLKFKGGKGAATGLGVIFAWDAVAATGAGVGFLVVLALTGFVSLGSVLGAVCFVGLRFLKTPRPFSREEFAMSVVSIGLLALIAYRHRANFQRIGAGTEPKVKLRKAKPKGSARVGLIVLTVAFAAATGLGLNLLRTNAVSVGSIRIAEIGRLATGHQRAERVLFLDGGKRLAATCPRYGRVVIAIADASKGLTLVKDVKLDGRPVALAEADGRLYVLQRPDGDARHLEEAWWETFDLDGNKVGDRVRVGWDPDDFVFHPDGRHVLVLSSGDAEGETNRPKPALLVFDRAGKPVARLEFDGKRDDPARLALSRDGETAAASIQGANMLVWIDLTDPAEPKLVRRESIAGASTPEAVVFDDAGLAWVADPDGVAMGRQETVGGPLVATGRLGASADVANVAGFIAVSSPKGSGVALIDRKTAAPIARLPIRGAANLAATRPLGLAVSPDGSLLAVANRAGGSVHLFRVERMENEAVALAERRPGE